jgi:hypothetical protein
MGTLFLPVSVEFLCWLYFCAVARCTSNMPSHDMGSPSLIWAPPPQNSSGKGSPSRAVCRNFAMGGEFGVRKKEGRRKLNPDEIVNMWRRKSRRVSV